MRTVSIWLLLSLLSLAGLCTDLGAQPRIAYVIPDIGAENMNTAVEIVAEQNATGTFGSDGLYLNNPGDNVRVEPTGPRAADLVVGPLVVSWNGRLISTQVFVRPNAPTGTVQLRVSAPSGQATVNFEIVSPTPTVNATGGGVIGSGGVGTRSKRGAMIVNTLVLDGSFTVSTADPDGTTAGNQGYLPLIIIARNVVNLRTATIDAGGNGKSGGPGGGGGAGQICDRTFFGNGGPGTNGGDGYSGGGSGGQNDSRPGGSNSAQSVGTGTFSGGQSLSLVAAGAGASSIGCYEGAGGGSGHPFGRSGESWCGTGNPTGGYGAGSTAGQTSSGGGGAYALNAQAGTGSNASDNYGRRHGNTHLVPFAGGSGGGGGNPQALNGGCGGEGGGGGGAIAIYSMDFFTSQATIRAQGAAGANGDGNADGGGGSGGAIIVGTKGMFNGSSASAGAYNVAGGSGPGGGGDGAAGRFRFDGFLTNTPSTGTAGATTYTGPSTDTLTYVEGYDFTLRGTRAASQPPIRIYMRKASTTWQQLGAPTVNGREWSLPITAADTGTWYIVALQQGAGGNGTWDDEPEWVNSQVAANIVKVAAVPRIDTVGAPTGDFGPVGNCFNDQAKGVLLFRSTGSQTLNVRTVLRNESTPGIFSVIFPAGIDTPGGVNYPPDPARTDSIRVRSVASVGGTHTADLLVITNDPRSGFDTLVVPLRVQRRIATAGFTEDTIDFGDVCINTQANDSAYIRFVGDVIAYQVNLAAVNNPTIPFYKVAAPASFNFRSPFQNPAYDSTVGIHVRFGPVTVGQFRDSIVIVDECFDSSVVYLVGRGVEAELSLSGAPAGLVNFGPVLVGDTRQGSIWIRNTGDSPVTLGNGTLVPPPGGPFRVVRPSPISGRTIAPGDSLEVLFEFTPDTIRQYNGTYNVDVQGPCADVPPIILRGQGVEICFSSSLDSITLIADSCDADPDPLRVVSLLKNCGGVPIDILEIYSVNGKLKDSALGGPLPFRMGTANANEREENLVLRWDPADGTGSDSIAIVWQDTNRDIRDTLYISATLLFDRAIVELQTVTGDTIPAIFDIGGVYQCGPAQDTVVLVNVGDIEGEITGRWAIGGIFDVDPTFATPYFLAKGESKELAIRLDPINAPTVGGVYTDTLILVNGRCNQEWRVPVRATRYQLEVTATDLDFGATNLNRARTGTVTLTNRTDAPPSEELTIERVYIDPPGASPPFAVDSTAMLSHDVQAKGGKTNVKVSFTPGAEQVYNGRLCFEISWPCDTTICVDLTGEGIRSNIYVPKRDLSFGDTYYCAEDTLGLTIFSVGPEPLRVDSIRIVGPDAPGFEIVTISRALPANMWPGFPNIVDSIEVAVRFIPANVPPDGPKSATLEIYSNDSAQGLVSIPLSGERTSPSIVGPALVDYGTVVVGGRSLQRVRLTNTSDDPITVANPQLGAPFRIVTPLPLVIPAKGSLDVDIEFAPDDSQTYVDTLVGTFTLPCAGEFRVALTGDGLRGETLVLIPGDLQGEPGERILVPIILQEATALADVGATTVRIWIRFNKSMLLPVDAAGGDEITPKRTASNGTIISDNVVGNERILELEFSNTPLPTAPGPLGFLDMVVLLGDELTTPIAIDSVRWVDGEVASQTQDGAFELTGYCDVGGDRLVRVDGTFGIRAVAPNPIGSRAAILFETVENGPTKIEIFDMTGRLVATLVDVPDLPVQAHLVELHTDGIAAGAYYVVLTTPTQRDVRGVVVGE